MTVAGADNSPYNDAELCELLLAYAESEIDPDMSVRPPPLKVGPHMFRSACQEAAEAITRLTAERDALAEALKPFAAWAVSFDGDAVEYPAPDSIHVSIRHNPSHKTSLTVGHLRQARALLVGDGG